MTRSIFLTACCSLAITCSAEASAQANTSELQADSGSATQLEGVWLPARVGGAPAPAANAQAPRAESAPQTTGTTLQCAPVQRLSGSGGGMTTLIIQGQDQIVMVSEEDMDIARKIYMNAQHPKQLVPQPNGHSIGHWDGNVLVVDTIGFSDKEGQDTGQHIVERLSKDGNTLNDAVTITDRNGATRTQTQKWVWRPDLQFNENVCEEGFDRYQVINGKLDNPNTPPDREKQNK